MAATLTISIELELGWGVHDIDEWDHLSDRGRAERMYLHRLLDLCDEVDVPITFDVVGHLFSTSCNGEHGGPAPEGWFDADPGTDVAADPLFYAPDMIEAIRSRSVDHELCTHTFSHLPAAKATDAEFLRDLVLAQHQHEEHLGERTPSLVPPRHYVPSATVMQEAGIEIVRESAPTGTTGIRRATELLFAPPPTIEPTIEDGIVRTYCSTPATLTAPALPSGQRSTHPVFRPLPVRLRQRLHARALDQATGRAIREDGHLHLWCHLYDLANDAQFEVIAAYLRRLGDLVDRGLLDVAPMATLNERVRDRHGLVSTTAPMGNPGSEQP